VNYLLGGVVAVETVFAFPGIGSELVAAVSARDIVVVQVIAIGIAGVLLVTFLIADLIGLLTNPRLRRSQK
jgi:peptide/nickel transport system permease protein